MTRLTIIEILPVINWYSKFAVFNIVYLLTSILLTLTSTLTHFSLYQNSMVISSVLDCESVWTLTVDILNTICNRDCFADCSLGLKLIVLFRKIAFLVCCWKQIIISRSWNWTYLQFSTQCSNGSQCVLCNFQWFLFSIMSVTILILGGHFFWDTLHICCFKCSNYIRIAAVIEVYCSVHKQVVRNVRKVHRKCHTLLTTATSMPASSNSFVIFFCFSAVAMCKAVSPFYSLYKHIHITTAHVNGCTALVLWQSIWLGWKGCPFSTHLVHWKQPSPTQICHQSFLILQSWLETLTAIIQTGDIRRLIW